VTNGKAERVGIPSVIYGSQRDEDNTIRVAVVDDHPIMRDGLAYVFTREEGFELVAQGASAKDAVEIAETYLPDLIFLDINMPGDGIGAAAIISRVCPATRIVMLTAHEGEQHVMKALRNGASGYLVKGVSAEELISMARAVHRGESYVSPGLAARLLGTRHQQSRHIGTERKFVNLTDRESEILHQVSEGKSNKEIGHILGLNEKTIKHYMSNVLQKLHVRNRVEAAMMVRESLDSKDGNSG
jgi:two-component system, NarL family, nitrate/nitrite response regulator NarL